MHCKNQAGSSLCHGMVYEHFLPESQQHISGNKDTASKLDDSKATHRAVNV